MASKASSLLLPILRQRTAPSITRLLPRRTPAPISFPLSVRAAHSIPRPPAPEARKPQVPNEDLSSEPASEGERPEIANPAYYQLSFTCVPCSHRSHHNISKQGYHTGSILITCPSCRNRHVISDHLNIFGDRKITVEDLMREKGRLVKRGSLGEDGDIEFWPDEESTAASDASGKFGGA